MWQHCALLCVLVLSLFRPALTVDTRYTLLQTGVECSANTTGPTTVLAETATAPAAECLRYCTSDGRSAVAFSYKVDSRTCKCHLDGGACCTTATQANTAVYVVDGHQSCNQLLIKTDREALTIWQRRDRLVNASCAAQTGVFYPELLVKHGLLIDTYGPIYNRPKNNAVLYGFVFTYHLMHANPQILVLTMASAEDASGFGGVDEYLGELAAQRLTCTVMQYTTAALRRYVSGYLSSCTAPTCITNTAAYTASLLDYDSMVPVADSTPAGCGGNIEYRVPRGMILPTNNVCDPDDTCAGSDGSLGYVRHAYTSLVSCLPIVYPNDTQPWDMSAETRDAILETALTELTGDNHVIHTHSEYVVNDTFIDVLTFYTYLYSRDRVYPRLQTAAFVFISSVLNESHAHWTVEVTDPATVADVLYQYYDGYTNVSCPANYSTSVFGTGCFAGLPHITYVVPLDATRNGGTPCPAGREETSVCLTADPGDWDATSIAFMSTSGSIFLLSVTMTVLSCLKRPKQHTHRSTKHKKSKQT